MIRLVRPSIEMKDKAIDFRQEFFSHNENTINGGFYERSFEFENEPADVYCIRL